MPSSRNRAANLEVYQFPCLQDNYGYLIRDPETGTTACIDTPSTEAIEKALAHIDAWTKENLK